MSHFLDRLTFFTRPGETFSDGHGITTLMLSEMLGMGTSEAPDSSGAPEFFVATQDNGGGAAPDTVVIQVPGIAKAGTLQCSSWAGDGSHRVPMMSRANQTPAFDSVRIQVGGAAAAATGAAAGAGNGATPATPAVPATPPTPAAQASKAAGATTSTKPATSSAKSSTTAAAVTQQAVAAAGTAGSSTSAAAPTTGAAGG